MSEEKFKLPGSSYDELVKIIKAYSYQKDETGLDEVAKLASIDKTVVSRNNKFLTSAGILDGAQKKKSTAIGRELGAALDHGIEKAVRDSWARVVDECDFLGKLVTSVRIRNGMDEATLQAHIAYSAGQPKKKIVMTGAKTVIDILRNSGMLVEEPDGRLVTDSSVKRRFSEDEVSQPQALGKTQIGQKFNTGDVVSLSRDSLGVGMNINVQVQINCEPSDLDGLGEKIRDFISQMAKAEEEVGED